MNNAAPAAVTGTSRATIMRAAPFAFVLVVLAAVAVTVSLAASPDVSKKLLVLPVLAVGGIALIVFALDRFEYFVLAMLALRSSLDVAKVADSGMASIVNPASLAALLFAGAGLAWIYARRRAGARHPASGLQTCALIYLAAVTVSALASSYPTVSALALLKAGTGVAMFFVVDRLITDERSLLRVLIAVLASSLIPLLVVGFGLVTGHQLSETKEGVRRVTATFAQSNPFAHYLVAVTLLCLGVLPFVPKRLRMPLGALSVAMMGCLGLTYTRGAWIGFVVGVLVFAWFLNRALILAVVAAAVLVVLVVPSVSARVHDLSSDPSAPRHVNSLEWRFRYWAEVLPLATQNPVSGIGLGGSSEQLGSGKAPHNDYLRSLVELGVIGLLVYLALIVQFVRISLRAFRVARTGLQRGVALGALSYAVAFACVSIADNLNDQVVLLWYIFTIMAMANWIARNGVEITTTPGVVIASPHRVSARVPALPLSAPVDSDVRNAP